MPGFDGTGPMGAGPMTGGARGYCAVPITKNNNSYQTDGITNDMPTPYYSQGLLMRRPYPYGMAGRGRGRRFARRRMW